jgi:hypothetical protein
MDTWLLQSNQKSWAAIAVTPGHYDGAYNHRKFCYNKIPFLEGPLNEKMPVPKSQSKQGLSKDQ